MMLTPPLFLLLLGLIGAHATVDLRTAAAMGKNNVLELEAADAAIPDM